MDPPRRHFLHRLLGVDGRTRAQTIILFLPRFRTVQFSMDLVNHVFRRKYTLKFLAHKLEFCHLRYSTFKTILAQPDFDWNPETNRLLASKEAWDRIFRAAVFPQTVMLEVGPSTAGLKDDAGSSNGVRSTSGGPLWNRDELRKGTAFWWTPLMRIDG
ncbi:hypothetical protein Salat_2612600 [Sesamum alatum]|uniref:Myb/SANT-like domain-containing protein n=1 Tax=Sesamum alatum TaxID=300844 RepID=A0AAE2CAR8_9LAMI|nr:hypothetical protein Salat_2612600 [Sesamum alatum]